jgi:uncharacterized membrane protein
VNNWKVIFATVVIFGAGVITGGLLVNYAQQNTKKSPRNKPSANMEAKSANIHQVENGKPRPPEILSKQFLQQLNESLQLRAEQREEIRKILADGQNQIRKAIQDARLEIREVLTSEQKELFDELIKRPFRKPIYNTNGPVLLPQSETNVVTSTNALVL